ncbi:MAG: hypothetical protein PSX81_16230 [bacterium]|nr:hypothetical protein [bacterium]
MTKVTKRSARYFYFLMKVLYENRDKLAVKMNKETHLYILSQSDSDFHPTDPNKVKHEINGVNVIYDEQIKNQTVILDVREVSAFSSYEIKII